MRLLQLQVKLRRKKTDNCKQENAPELQNACVCVRVRVSACVCVRVLAYALRRE